MDLQKCSKCHRLTCDLYDKQCKECHEQTVRHQTRYDAGRREDRRMARELFETLYLGRTYAEDEDWD